jgi:aspartate carbamoyltransferase regulatory subunit
MRIFQRIEKYDQVEVFKCRHCNCITDHVLMKVKEQKVEPERADNNKILLVWVCMYCLDSERTERINKN